MLFLIDGNHTCCRDRFGAGRAAIADLTKRRVQAIYRKWKPKQVIACFDQGKSFRHDLFSQYKSGREESRGIQFDLEVARLACRCSGVLCLFPFDYYRQKTSVLRARNIHPSSRRRITPVEGHAVSTQALANRRPHAIN